MLYPRDERRCCKVMTVHEVCALTGLTERTLRYYDGIGLLKPSGRTQAGYRLYGEEDLVMLRHIMMYRELQFPLKDIIRILKSPDFDRDRALDQQIALLEMKRERLQAIIDLAREIKKTGGQTMTDLKAFDTDRIDRYAAEAKAAWGQTDAYKEYEQKAKKRGRDEEARLGEDMMALFGELGALKGQDPASPQVRGVIKKLRDFISEHWYTCTDQIFLGLGEMYAAGGEMTENIDRRGGEGTGAFAREAIRAFCGK